MTGIIRKHQKTLMLILTAIVCVAFAWLYSPADMKGLRTNDALRVYGKTYTHADLNRMGLGYNLALMLGQGPLITALAETDASGEPSALAYIVNLIVLRHEARAHGVVATDDQVIEKIRAVPHFQTGGQFDRSKFEQFANTRLVPFGMTMRNVEDVMRDAIVFERMMAFISAPAAPTAAEREIVERNNASMDLKVLNFPLVNALIATTISDDDVKAEFEANPERYVKPEGLILEVAQFDLPEDKRELTGRERVNAQQEVVSKAAAFAEGATAENFAARAAEHGATVKTTGPIESAATQTEVPQAVARAAFFLNDVRRISDPIEDGNSFYIVRVAERVASRPLELSEAQEQIRDTLQQRTAVETIRRQADAAIAKIREAQGAGASLDEALATAGVEVKDITGASLNDQEIEPQSRMAAQIAVLLQPGQVSNPYPAAAGMEIVALVKREEGKDKTAYNLTEFVDSKRRLFFNSWLSARREAANIVAAQGPQQR